MFVGHYSASFAIKRARPEIPLWVLFLAVQAVDVAWAIFVLLGIERAHTDASAVGGMRLRLDYIPYTHSLLASALWAGAGALAYRALRHGSSAGAAAWVGAAVLSHWGLDFLVHASDLPLYDNALHVGLGLWRYPLGSYALEAGLLAGGLALYLPIAPLRARGALVGFTAALVAIQAFLFFGPPPSGMHAVVGEALASYAGFAAVAGWIADRGSSNQNRLP